MMEQMSESKSEEISEPETEGPIGIDDIISRVEGYAADPKLVTAETLTELLGELKDLKSYLDGGDEPETEPENPGNSNGKPSLMISIGEKMKGGGKY